MPRRALPEIAQIRRPSSSSAWDRERSEDRDIDRAFVTMSIAHQLELNGLAAPQARDGRPVATAHAQRRFRKGSDKQDMDQAPIGLKRSNDGCSHRI
jgi:hypothetical protein